MLTIKVKLMTKPFVQLISPIPGPRTLPLLAACCRINSPQPPLSETQARSGQGVKWKGCITGVRWMALQEYIPVIWFSGTPIPPLPPYTQSYNNLHLLLGSDVWVYIRMGELHGSTRYRQLSFALDKCTSTTKASKRAFVCVLCYMRIQLSHNELFCCRPHV